MKGSQLSQYLVISSLDKIVRHVEGVELLQLDEGLQVVDLVVGDPQLLEGFPDCLDPCQALNQVSSQRQDLQILQVLQVLNAG